MTENMAAENLRERFDAFWDKGIAVNGIELNGNAARSLRELGLAAAAEIDRLEKLLRSPDRLSIERVLERHIVKCYRFAHILNQDGQHDMATRLQGHISETAQLLDTFAEHGHAELEWPETRDDWIGI